MKILHVTKKYPDALGGDAVVVANLQKHQEAAGYQVAILTSNCPEIRRGRHIYRFGLSDTPEALDHITLRRLLSLVGLFFKAFVVLFRERPDVIHTHSVDMAFFVSFAARFFWIPIVHTFHIVTFYDQDQPLLRRKSELWLAKAAGLRIITAPNAHDVAALYDAGLRQTVVLPNGVDLEFWQPPIQRQQSHNRNQPFTFISVGRLETQKGYDYLIKAISLIVAQSNQPFRILLVGEGSQKEPLQHMVAAHNLQDVVEFAGRKPPPEVRELLGQADAAIFPSLYETTPITLLEAWAMGLPVVMTPVGILRSLTPDSDHVYMAQTKDPQSLSMAMLRCMTDEDMRKRIAAAGHTEVQKYQWSNIAETTATLYGSVL